MRAWLSGIFAFRACVILVGIAWVCFYAPAAVYAADDAVSEIMTELNARNAVFGQAARRVEDFLAGDETFSEDRLQTAVSGMTRLGFSENDISRVTKMAGVCAAVRESVSGSDAGPAGEKTFSWDTDNAYLLVALETLSDGGADENVRKAMDFAKNEFGRKSESACLVMALAGNEKDAAEIARFADALKDWAGFEARLAAVILAPGMPWEGMPQDEPCGPVAEIMAAVCASGGGRVSSEKNGGTLLAGAATVVVPENKRFFSVQTASQTPPAGYFLIAQTDIRRE